MFKLKINISCIQGVYWWFSCFKPTASLLKWEQYNKKKNMRWPATQDPGPATRDPRLTTHDPRPATQDPRAATHDPRPSTHDPQPTTRDPQPATQNLLKEIEKSLFYSFLGMSCILMCVIKSIYRQNFDLWSKSAGYEKNWSVLIKNMSLKLFKLTFERSFFFYPIKVHCDNI